MPGNDVSGLAMVKYYSMNHATYFRDIVTLKFEPGC